MVVLVLRGLLWLVVGIALLAIFGLISYRIAYRDWPWNQPAKIAVCDGHWKRSTLPTRSRHELRLRRLYEIKRVPPFVGEQLLSATPLRGGGTCDDRLYLRTFGGRYIVYRRGR
jgi:hypothetical protein